MTKLMWDKVGERFFETGVDHGVLFIPDSNGAYSNGVAWSGLTGVTESPSGAEPNAQYADNIKYLNLYSAEDFAATIEAFTYPPEFAQFDGQVVPTPGVGIGQQPRKVFGFCYRTLKGNDLLGADLGYKIHMVYGAQASPSEKSNATVNESPEPTTMSWSIATTPVPVTGYKPAAHIYVDSTEVDADVLEALEQILYGDVGVDPAMPLPDTIISMFSAGVTIVTPTQPSFNSGTETITIPTVTGVAYYIDDVVVPAGPVVITADTVVEARPNAGYVFAEGVDDDWLYDYTP